MGEPKTSIGVVVRMMTQHGYTYLVAEVLGRDEGADFPRGVSWWGEVKSPCLDGLSMRGRIYESRNAAEPSRFHLDRAEYREVFSVELPRARSMCVVLARIAAQIERDQAFEHGDRFLAFCRAVGARWVCFPHRSSAEVRSAWSDTRWVWYGLTDGRNEYRSRVARWIEETDAKLAASRAPVAPAPSADAYGDFVNRVA